MPVGDRGGRFGGNLIKAPSSLGEVPAAIPDDEPTPPRPTAVPDPTPAPDPTPEPAGGGAEEEPRLRTRRKPPVNVRLRLSTAGKFQEGYLEEKARDLDLSITDYASDLIEEALVARRRQRKR